MYIFSAFNVENDAKQLFIVKWVNMIKFNLRIFSNSD